LRKRAHRGPHTRLDLVSVRWMEKCLSMSRESALRCSYPGPRIAHLDAPSYLLAPITAFVDPEVTRCGVYPMIRPDRLTLRETLPRKPQG
jgi:hypothetical protein